jgi:hypothetical protein
VRADARGLRRGHMRAANCRVGKRRELRYERIRPQRQGYSQTFGASAAFSPGCSPRPRGLPCHSGGAADQGEIVEKTSTSTATAFNAKEREGTRRSPGASWRVLPFASPSRSFAMKAVDVDVDVSARVSLPVRRTASVARRRLGAREHPGEKPAPAPKIREEPQKNSSSRARGSVRQPGVRDPEFPRSNWCVRRLSSFSNPAVCSATGSVQTLLQRGRARSQNQCGTGPATSIRAGARGARP